MNAVPFSTEVVVALDAKDEFLKSRVMNLPESVVAGTHNTEEGERAKPRRPVTRRMGKSAGTFPAPFCPAMTAQLSVKSCGYRAFSMFG